MSSCFRTLPPSDLRWYIVRCGRVVHDESGINDASPDTLFTCVSNPRFSGGIWESDGTSTKRATKTYFGE